MSGAVVLLATLLVTGTVLAEPRTPTGVPLALEPERLFTAAEFNRLRAAMSCERVPTVSGGDAIRQRDVNELKRCASGQALSPAERTTLDRLRWLVGERW